MREPRGVDRDRAVATTVSHVLALAVTAVLVSGLMIAANGVYQDRKDQAARTELTTIGNRMADELTRISGMAREGGNVSLTVHYQSRVAGSGYDVELETGGACDAPLFDTNACLRLSIDGNDTVVRVPVENDTGVSLTPRGSGRFTLEAEVNDSRSSELDPPTGVSATIGIGDEIDRVRNGTSINPANRQPIAGFTFTPGQPTVDSVIRFQNDTEDLDGIITSYEWDLGDGTTKTGRTFNHSYSDPGKYTVSLTVTDDDNETSTVEKVVVVSGLVYNEDATAGNVSASVEHGHVDFTVTNKHGGEVQLKELLIDPHNDSLDWLAEAESGVFEVDIDGDNEAFTEDDDQEIYDGGRVLEIDGRLSAGSDAPIAFNGFGETSGTPKADMSDETVDVSIWYSVGGVFYSTGFTLFGDRSADDPPSASFTADCDDDTLECSFDGTGSSDPDGSITDYEWDFDDGNVTSGPDSLNHTFPSNGSFDVSLTVTDNNGTTTTTTKSIDFGDGSTFSVKINFQKPSSSTPSGYEADDGDQYGDRGNGYTYGWLGGGNSEHRDRGADPDQRYDTLNHLQKAGENRTWEIDVPNGEYDVRVVAGDPSYTDQTNTYAIEDTVVTDPDGEDNWDDYNVTVAVDDGRLTITPASGSDNAKLAFVHVTSVALTAYDQSANVPGRVVMEAERYMDSEPGNNDDEGPSNGDDMSPHSWTEISDSDASNNTALEATPNWGDNAQDTENGERLDYRVEFSSTGTHYVWVRMECPGGGDDSVHVGLNGTPESYGDIGLTADDSTTCNSAGGWFWASHADGSHVTLDVSSTGVHTVNLWMREDGTRIDKIIVTDDPSYEPSGTGPSESDRN